MTSFTNVVKHTTVLSAVLRPSTGLTWDQDTATWNQNTGTWDEPTAFANTARNTTALTNQTKN